MVLQIKITGILLLVLSFAHIIFPRYFKWKAEFGSVSLINRQMMYVHAFFIGFAVLLMGILCLTSATDLITTSLGKKISLGLGIFWLVRLLFQFFGYSSLLWKGKKFETAVHIFFSIAWIYFSAVFMLAYFS